MKFSIIFILIIIAIIFYLINLYTSYSENTYVKSTLDNNTYVIRNSHNKSVEFLQNSANTLASINIKMDILINYLVKKYSKDSGNNYWVNKLRENYKPYMISEAAVNKLYTTYTIDKTDMRVCLRTRDSKEDLYDINLLMYVVLHESGHMGNYSPNGIPILGHEENFKRIFAILVKEAIQLGLYKYENYAKNPKEYCGLILQSQIIG